MISPDAVTMWRVTADSRAVIAVLACLEAKVDNLVFLRVAPNPEKVDAAQQESVALLDALRQSFAGLVTAPGLDQATFGWLCGVPMERALGACP